MRPVDVKTIDDAQAAIQRLAKWRSHFAGWLLGTRAKDDPQSQWVRDNTEKLLLLRAESSALMRILIDKGVCTAEEATLQVGMEAVALSNAFERQWPGVKASDDGLEYNIATIQQAGWMRNWLP